jgi:hypothetical protein
MATKMIFLNAIQKAFQILKLKANLNHETSTIFGAMKVLLWWNKRQISHVKNFIWCSHEWGKLKTEGGTTPPLARKLPQWFADLFPSPWGIFTQFNSRHNIRMNCTILNTGRHSTFQDANSFTLSFMNYIYILCTNISFTRQCTGPWKLS